MLKNFNLQLPKDAKGYAQWALALLVVCNLVAAYFWLYPPGGSPKDLEQQITDLRAQVLQRNLLLRQTRAHAGTIERGRGEGTQFLDAYFMNARVASSTIVDELSQAAAQTKITPKEHSFQVEDVEGSDTLKMMSINGNYEGTYTNLIDFINRIDRSKRLLIIESLGATPQQGKGKLNVNIKMNAFVRDEGNGL